MKKRVGVRAPDYYIGRWPQYVMKIYLIEVYSQQSATIYTPVEQQIYIPAQQIKLVYFKIALLPEI